jgi:predicted PurR-regulated permease PerM
MKTQSASEIRQALYIVLLLIGVVAILYYGSSFLIPLAYGAMFAFLVDPVHRQLLAWGSNKYLSAVLSTLLVVLFIVLLLSALAWQIRELVEQSDQVRQELVELQQQLQQYLKKWFGITISEQKEYAEDAVNKLQSNIGSFIGDTATILTNFLLSLVYSILLLAERKRISKFFLRLFEKDENAEETIDKTAKVTQRYLVGKMIIIGIVAVVYGIGFLIAGIQYAILLAVLAAFLTFIPYVGNLIGAALASLITLATGGSVTEILIILAVLSVAQVVESYILQPWIVGSNVNLNPLFSIIAVVGLGAIWGAAGAIIALPLFGMLKILFDQIKAFEPLGFLLGDGEVGEE